MGIVNSLFSYLLDFTLWEGSIFEAWLPMVARKLVKIFKPEEYEVIIKEPASQQNNSFITSAAGLKLYKILGGCIICVNVWLGMISWFIICLCTGIFHPAYGFVYILVGNAFLRKLTGVVYK